MNQINTLDFCLQSITKLAGSNGVDSATASKTEEFFEAYANHNVSNELALSVSGEPISLFLGITYDLDDTSKADLVNGAIAAATAEGWADVKFTMDPIALDTTLGSLATKMYFDNGGE